MVPSHGQGKARFTGLGLAGLNIFSRLWGAEAVSSGLGPGPRMIRAEECDYAFWGMTEESVPVQALG